MYTKDQTGNNIVKILEGKFDNGIFQGFGRKIEGA